MALIVLIRCMIFMGVALMVYNIYRYIRYARSIEGKENWGTERRVLRIPIVLLVMFLLGYIAVGLFGTPDLIIAGILFGGSIFVFLIFWVLQRITFRIQEGERLEARARAAEESNRIKSSFLASVSHEMRTPMNAILGLDNLALTDTELRADTRRRLEEIGSSARHMIDLIDDILTMHDTESDQLVMSRDVFSIGTFLAEIDGMVSIQCAEKGLCYESVIDIPEEERFCGDEKKLRRALLVLLDNAVKFNEPGGFVALRVRRLPDRDGKPCLCFAVEDSGVGIDQAYLPKLFQLFSQEDSSSTSRFGGSGLGLALAKRVADLMDGDLRVESEKGKGSTFTLSVCLESAPPGEDRPEKAPENFRLEGRRVLIAEDIDLNAEILADLLELEGIRSERAENGRIALELFSAAPPGKYDAILMDLRMPVMDGLTAAREIRATDRPDAKTIPIIALTANSFQEDVERCREAGMNEHLAKPAEPEILYGTLAKWINLREKGQMEG